VFYRGDQIAFTALKKRLRKISRPLPPDARAIVVRERSSLAPNLQEHEVTGSEPDDRSAARSNADYASP
jgi:hypothetical protein